MIAFRGTAPSAIELYAQAASLVPMGAFSCDLASERLSWTEGVFDIFGLPADEPVERQRTVAMYSESSRELLERVRSRAIHSRTSFSLDANIIRHDGTDRWIRITASVRSSNGRAETLFGMKQDITEDRARWDMLQAQAECDPLTGVANRGPFQCFLDGSRHDLTLNSVGALILFDLDGFKRLNDLWGHAAGDSCLSAFGERLRRAFPQARLVSRIGGDEFAVLLPPCGSRARVENVLASAIGDLLGPVPWNGELLPLSASVGLALTSEAKNSDPQNLFIAADRALYDAKKNRVGVIVGTSQIALSGRCA